jgi:integrase/recombinase XerD
MSLIKIKSFHAPSQDKTNPTISIYTLVEATSRFIADSDITQNSKQTYTRSLQSFFNWLHQIHGEEFRLYRQHILEYKEFLDKKGLKPYTRSLYLVAVRRFFEWCETMLLYPNISKGIKVSRGLQKTHNKDSLSQEKIKLLLDSIDQKDTEGMRDYALIHLLIHTGLRLIEIQRALISDIEKHESGKYLLWVRGKGRDGKDNFVILVHDVIVVLLNYITRRNLFLISKEPLFSSLSDRNHGKQLTTQSLSRIIKNRLQGANIKTKRITAHSLRHTFGVLAIQTGASLYEVQLAMRHLSSQTTQIYLGDIERSKRLEGNPEEKISHLIKNIKI